MTTPRWETLGQVSPSRLAEARLLLHHAAQLVASVGRSLVPPRPDDGHTSLAWDGDLRGLVGQEVAGERAWRAGLVPEDLVAGGARRRRRRAPAGARRPDDGRGPRLARRSRRAALGAPDGRLTFEAPYAMPPHPVGAGQRFAAPADGSLAEVARWFANADGSSARSRRAGPGRRPCGCGRTTSTSAPSSRSAAGARRGGPVDRRRPLAGRRGHPRAVLLRDAVAPAGSRRAAPRPRRARPLAPRGLDGGRAHRRRPRRRGRRRGAGGAGAAFLAEAVSALRARHERRRA